MNIKSYISRFAVLLFTSCIAFSSHAASILAANTTYDMSIRTGTSCFAFADAQSCAEVSMFNLFTDNGRLATDAGGMTRGSSINGDGWAGVIRFTTDASGENFSVDTFSQDAFESLPPSDTVVWADDASRMHGTVDAAGNMLFVPESRTAFIYEFFPNLGNQDWVFDDSSNVQAPSNDWLALTTGTATGKQFIGVSNPPYSLTGSPLTSDGTGEFDGRLVSAGNMGDGWGVASGSPYVEIWDVHVATVVPLPATAWLLVSGLLGLAGVATHNKKRRTQL